MGLYSKFSLVSDSVDIICTIDGMGVSSITDLSYTHSVNSARMVSITLANIDTRSIARIGARVVLSVGRNDVKRGTTHQLDFTGIVVEASPSIDVTTILVADYVTFLQNSEYVNYKLSDIVGHDLYFLAADACNYRDIDTSTLLKGSGIMATEEMNLEGLQTRREFIDKCFENMEAFVNDSEHNEVVVVKWRYGILRDNIMDFWLEDPKNKKFVRPILTVSETSNNLIGDGLVTSVDSTQIVNSATYQSSIDPTIFATVTDEDSVRRFGVKSKLYQSNIKSTGDLETLAYEAVTLFKEPTFSYNITMTNGEHISLGDYIKIKNIAYEEEEVLPVVEVSHTFGDSIQSNIVVGKPELTLKQYIEEGLR